MAVIDSAVTGPDLLAHFERQHPWAAELAVASSLPVRVTPAFLRLVRLRLVPEARTGDEADLWLSDLVESRSGAGFAYRPDVRRRLRERLRRDRAALDRVWREVHLVHAPWLAPRTRLEEELTWRLLRDPADPALEAHWAGVVDELDAGAQREGLARWVVRAVPDLPPGALDAPSALRAWHGAHLMLGDASVLGQEAQRFLDSGELAFATRRLPRRTLNVGLAGNRLLVSAGTPIRNGHALEVPATRPLWLQVEGHATAVAGSATWRDAAPMVLTIDGEAPVAYAFTAEAAPAGLDLRLIDGSVWRLERRAGQRFIARDRAPRVDLTYDVEMYGAAKKVHLPFVVGVLADLSGHHSEPPLPVQERKFLHIDVDNFEARMRALGPRLAFRVAMRVAGRSELSVDLTFQRVEDFGPESIASRVRPLRDLLQARRVLDGLRRWVESGNDPDDRLTGPLRDWLQLPREDRAARDRLARQIVRIPPARSWHAVDSADLTEALTTLSGELRLDLPPRTTPNARDMLGMMTSAVDELLNEPLNAILRHADFQRLEAAWRGLHFLVSRTETDEMLKIRVLDISKKELTQALARTRGALWDQSAIFKKVYEEEFGQFGGEPYGCLVGDFEFDHSPTDVATLGELAKIAAAGHCPFIAGAAPSLLGVQSWQELDGRRDLGKALQTPEYVGWRSLREADESGQIALALPRFLGRMPYGQASNPIQSFDFEEDIGDAATDRLVWINAAYAVASNVTRAFKQYGWCATIRGFESGGLVEALPMAPFARGRSAMARGPTEAFFTDRREAELSRLGLLPLMHRSNSDSAAFVSASTLHKPLEYEDPDSTAAAALATQLPFRFAIGRFVHYLLCIQRDAIGSFRTTEEIERHLISWIMQYVNPHEDASPEEQARYPLLAADLHVEPIEGESRLARLVVFLQPRYQLPALTVSLRTVARLALPDA